ncbi:pyridoxal phosphate-dependent transferase [Obelidium mucronatum]|nr:pyridoxal phosphate-dependent transferase [Obelidium mucronatum]
MTFDGPPPAFGSKEMRAQFSLDPKYIATNHGSFGAAPKLVIEERIKQMLYIEHNPDTFCKIDYDGVLDKALEPVAKICGLDDVSEIVFTVNATTGVNAVLRRLRSKPKRSFFCPLFMETYLTRLITTAINDQFVPLQLDIESPISDSDLIKKVEALIERERTDGNDIVLAVYDIVSSIPGIVCPYVELTRLFQRHNILTCIDGAHAIGQVPLNLKTLKPDFLVTNLHKWLFVPRGCCVFYCSRRFHGVIRHPVISEVRPGDWRRGFHWVGTTDVSAYLTAPAAIGFREWIGGEDAIMAYNHNLAIKGGEIVAKKLGTFIMRGIGQGESTFGNGLTASMVNVAVPETPVVTEQFMNGLQVYLLKEWNCGTAPYKHGGRYWLRLSAQVYLNEEDFENLANILRKVFFPFAINFVHLVPPN